jgi:hypothetical protein
MIRDIKELNFPNYATLNKATVTLNEMGDKSIESTISIDGDITPDFSYEWQVTFRDELYVTTVREPQISKENTSRYSSTTLTFTHWAIYQLKRFYFFNFTAVDSGTATPDKWIDSINLDLKNFVAHTQQILYYWYGDAISIQLNPEWEDDADPIFLSISYTYIWDLLQKVYEYYGVRWYIKALDKKKYVIMVGYDADEITHVFQYGFDGGLLKIERQIQSDDIRNMILGRGGDKNLPLRYFKDVDPDNTAWTADPDWIPELANIYFSELRGKTFRDYVRGWKAKHYGGQEYDATWAYLKGYTDEKFDPVEYVKDDESIEKYGELLGSLENNEDIYPTIQGITQDYCGRVDECVAVEQVTVDNADDATEDEEDYGLEQISIPVVQDWVIDYKASAIVFKVNYTTSFECKSTQTYSITKGDIKLTNGFEVVEDNFRTLAALTNSDSYTLMRTISVVNVSADEAMNCEIETTSDTYVVVKSKTDASVSGKKTIVGHAGTETFRTESKDLQATRCTWIGGSFTIPEKKTGNIVLGSYKIPTTGIVVDSETDTLYDADGNVVDLLVGLKPGTYSKLVRVLSVRNDDNTVMTISSTSDTFVQASTEGLIVADSRLFSVWIKNIWNDTQEDGETDDEFVSRIWTPIIGDRWGNEAKVIFSSGFLGTSEDYEFSIYAIYHDESKEYGGYKSMWRLSLIKSDADYDSLGMLVPNTQRQGKAGDHFFFTGIELPHQYVLWAEEELDDYKTDEGLEEYSDIKPTYSVTLDKIRISESSEKDKELDDEGVEQVYTLISKMDVGKKVRLQDKRFIDGEESLFTNAVTITYGESLYPNVEVTLLDTISTVTSSVEALKGEVDSLYGKINSSSNTKALIQQVGDERYLRKNAEDTAQKKITFNEGLKSVKDLTVGNFVSSLYAGTGAGVDKYGNAEVESLKVRSGLEVLSLIVNNLQAIDGDRILTDSAQIESIVSLGDGKSYGLFLKSKWDGWITGFQEYDVIKGIYNTLEVGSTGSYITSWMRVDMVNSARNYIEVTIYDDSDVPAQKNYAPQEMMNIARWGNQVDEDRQSCLYLSSTEGRIVKLTGVTKPILEDYNYGTTMGTLPEFVQEIPKVQAQINPNWDYMYAAGIICQSFIQVDYEGKPISEYVDRGEWVEGESYYCNDINPSTGKYEISLVYHNGCKWQCNKTGATDEPKWNTTQWSMIEGNTQLKVEFLEQEQIYDMDDIQITLTPIVTLYNEDITDQLVDTDFEWTRYSVGADGNERPSSDTTWGLAHADTGKQLNATIDDLGVDSFGFPKKVVFTCTVTVKDGLVSSASLEF